jgi:diketogulonate reductase-like aldo/keto reductase
MKYATLRNENKMPLIGLGTWKSEPEKAYEAVLVALKNGYRHIDTAMIYNNEEAVGRAIKDSNIPREELFVTTKLWNSDQGYESTKKALETSLDKLGLEYVDLYLIHWFKGYDLMKSSYKAMQEMYHEGKVKALGVSNYNIHHLMALLDYADVLPMVNQVETHIGLQNHFLQSFCEENNIQLEAYAPLMSWKIKEVLENETLQSLAKRYNKTVPQVVLRWFVERGVVAIPKSVTPSRIIENIDIFDFELTKDDVTNINALNQGAKLFPEFDNVIF